ncbi:hypothetical protein M422DRAFT_255383 [Sphaerobolus stellatus SS14]|uniref:Uncharacterized protein n=1 Tax=Sphaerobolus stellatus (strain SS14) TaxID=990650 RepID=A0A0C9VIX2_SPHS4|nr:hypothetical protein M422DRAFT_255383 [Sphaerobolus stellatus SS14]
MNSPKERMEDWIEGSVRPEQSRIVIFLRKKQQEQERSNKHRPSFSSAAPSRNYTIGGNSKNLTSSFLQRSFKRPSFNGSFSYVVQPVGGGGETGTLSPLSLLPPSPLPSPLPSIHPSIPPPSLLLSPSYSTSTTVIPPAVDINVAFLAAFNITAAFIQNSSPHSGGFSFLSLSFLAFVVASLTPCMAPWLFFGIVQGLGAAM